MKKHPFYQVDAFTSKLFGGNQAAVCPLEEWLPDEVMQQLAAENNLSETAFFVPSENGFDIRWFTPLAEIDLAGHPTLATAHVIYEHLNFAENEIVFNSKSGELIVKRSDKGYVMDFPSRMPCQTETPEGLAEALGDTPIDVLESRDLFVVFPNRESIENLQPDFDKIAKVHKHAVIVTSPGTDSDFVSRFFAPAIGINEDPVTGSAHASLIPYWARELGKNKLTAIQLSKRIGHINGEFCGKRVFIEGQAVSYLTGEYTLHDY